MSSTLSVPCPVHHRAQTNPSALALLSNESRWTYAQLDSAIAAARAQFGAKGIQRGTQVALRMTRGPLFVVLLWALWREGAVAVPLSSRVPPEKALHKARRVGASHVITSESALLEKREEGLDTCSPDLFTGERGRSTPSPSAQGLERPATIVFTTGSTGEPKGILHTWKNHLYSAKGSNANIPLRRGDRWLLSLPLYHVGGLAILVRCALVGAGVAIPRGQLPSSEAVADMDVTHASLVATQFRRLLNAIDEGPPGHFRALLLGGGPLPEPLLRRGHARGWPIHTSYGSTEMTSQITTTPPGAPFNTLRTAGRCLPHRRLQVDEHGQILVTGPTLCAGIVEEGELQDPRVEGWYPTGDLGTVDASGRLHVTGRVDRQFVSGGENIQPEEIESALERIDGVERAVVVSIRDEEFGRRPVGFLQGNMDAVSEHWAARLEDLLPRFKIPVDVFPLPRAALQKSSGVKVNYECLRRTAAEKVREERAPSSEA